MGRMSSYENQVIRGKYMPHVDGVRALAVVAVVLYHFGSRLCPGGFSGVDVFFVISGFLIGGGILRDLRNGEFSFVDFYVRRIKRIMPAYFMMIGTALLAGLLLYHYELLEDLGNAAFRSAYYFANFFFYKYVGNYFAGNADTHALTNLWSLSVEEQFYIVIPFLMWLIWKLRARALPYALGILALVSIINAETLLRTPVIHSHIKAFYMLLPRMWELLAGVLLAWAPGVEASGKRSRYAWVGGIVGIICVLGSYAYLSKGGFFPGSGVLPAVIGAMLLIRYGASGWVGRVLTNTLVVGIGRISYSLYLWHWPIIVYARYIWGDELSLPILLGAAALSVAVAYASWKWVEMPVRRARHLSPTKAFVGVALVSVLVGGCGYMLKKSRGLVHYIHPTANSYASLDYPGKCEPIPSGHFGVAQLSQLPDEKGRMRDNNVVYVGERTKAPQFVLIGDSHAEAIRSGLDVACAEKGIAGVYINAKTCPILGIEILNTFSNITENFLQWLESAPGINLVIIQCRWSTRLSSTDQILYRKGEPVPADNHQNTALLEEGIRNTCKRLKEMGKEVVLMGPIPALRFSPGSAVRRRIMLGQPVDDLGESVSVEEFMNAEKEVFRILSAIEAEGLARMVSTHPALNQNGQFRGLMEGKLMYHDSNHLSKDGAIHVIRHALPRLFPAAAPEGSSEK